MDSLSALDAEFLHLETDVTMLHIGGIATFEGPMPSYDEFVAGLEAKLHLIPRYRQRVASVPLELGRPVWVDDPNFSVGRHVQHTALPKPGDDAALCRLMGRLMGQLMDRSRPLWEVWMVEGLHDDGWALIFKVHHCMVDGIAGVGLLAAVLDATPEPSVGEPVPWTPEPAPSNLARVGHAWSGAIGDLASLVGQLPHAATDPVGTMRAARGAAQGLIGFGRHSTPVPPLSIEGPIGAQRAYAHASITIADIKTIRNAFGGTLNDVVLACITRGMADLLVAHGDDLDEAIVRTGVPVSVRRADGEGVADNRVSALLIELPVSLDDPLDRYEAVQAAMAEGKASGMSEVGEQMAHLADLAPPAALGVISRAAVRANHRFPQRSVNTVTTNVPGPQIPLYSMGREMQAYLPYVPIADGVRVGTAMLSYNGVVAFGVTADLDSVPDPDVLAEGITAGLDELLDLAREGA